MDFDDLDDAEVALGPSPEEMRQQLLEKQVPENMPGARKHPKPIGKGFGGGVLKYQKVLYLHGPGSNKKICERQVGALFKNVPWVHDFKIFEWHFWEGSINFKVEEIHADPAVAEVFKPFGNKNGDTYDGYMSYLVQSNLNRQDETWQGPGENGKLPENIDNVMDGLAKHLEETGPYDGLCGFDMGGCLAFEAARLAQEGDERFKEKFRYLMLFSTHSHKELASFGQGKLRPKAPLMIPTFIGWSLMDDGRPYPAYEDLCLYIHPRYRGVFYHDQGHRPPNIQKNTPACEELDVFVGRMQADTRYDPTDSKECLAYRSFWLPLIREPLPEVTADRSRVLYVCPDPLGEHGPMPEDAADRMRFPAQEDPSNCAMRLAAYRIITSTTAEDFIKASDLLGEGIKIEIQEVKYSDEVRNAPWHPKEEKRDVSAAYVAGQGRSRWLQVEDEVILPWAEMRRMADEILETIACNRDDCIGIVGMGTGAIIAFLVAESLLRVRQISPVRLFTMYPPTVWPFEDAPQMGALVNTPIRYLTVPYSVTAPPWRLETSTFGDFSHVHLSSKEDAIEKVLKEMQDL